MRTEFIYERIGEKLYPIIPMLVGFEKNWIPVSALVDSGAAISIFNADVGRALCIDVESGRKMEISGISGKVFAFVHKVKLNVGEKEFEAEVAFTDELAVPINLFGRKDAFENFIISIDESENKLIFENRK